MHPHTCVDVGVFLHVRLLVEALATVGAGEWTGVGVDEKMGGEGGGALEALAALRAHEGAAVLVHGAVLVAADGVAKRLRAHVAGVGPRAGVQAPHVHFQPMRRRKQLRALRAAVAAWHLRHRRRRRKRMMMRMRTSRGRHEQGRPR